MQTAKNQSEFPIVMSRSFFLVAAQYEHQRWYCLDDVFDRLDTLGMLKSRTSRILSTLREEISLGVQGQVSFPTDNYELLKSRYVDISQTRNQVGTWKTFIEEPTAKKLWTLARNLNILLQDGDLSTLESARGQIAPHYKGKIGFKNDNINEIKKKLASKINLSKKIQLYERDALLVTDFYSAPGGVAPCFQLWPNNETLYCHSKTIALLEKSLPTIDLELDFQRMETIITEDERYSISRRTPYEHRFGFVGTRPSDASKLWQSK